MALAESYQESRRQVEQLVERFERNLDVYRTSEVGAEFLREIEGWREALARNIALRNPVSVHELNFAVQHAIDRIVFLRMAEDRGLETHGRRLALCAGRDIYPRLVSDLYRQADEKYNSGLFDFLEVQGT